LIDILNIKKSLSKKPHKTGDTEYFRNPVVKYGYCRGEEPFNYVKEILDRDEHYRNIIGGK